MSFGKEKKIDAGCLIQALGLFGKSYLSSAFLGTYLSPRWRGGLFAAFYPIQYAPYLKIKFPLAN